MGGHVTDTRLLYALLPLLADGLDNDEIARKLLLSRNGLKSRLSSLLVHLSARNRTHAVAIAHERGLLPAVDGQVRTTRFKWTVRDGNRLVAGVTTKEGRIILDVRSELDLGHARDLRFKLGAAIGLALNEAEAWEPEP